MLRDFDPGYQTQENKSHSNCNQVYNMPLHFAKIEKMMYCREMIFKAGSPSGISTSILITPSPDLTKTGLENEPPIVFNT